MDLRLLTAAALATALAFSPAPAEAQQFTGMRPSEIRPPEVPIVHPFRHDFACRDGDFRRMRHDVRRDGRRDGGFGCAFGDGFAYADGEWALYNNRAFDPDSYNDWWNDRPDRAFPRWVREQHARGTCDPDRMWWSGSGWHC